MKHPLTLTAAAVGIGLTVAGAAGLVGHAQAELDPGPPAAPPTYMRIDDQLIDVTDHVVVVNGQIRLRPQGATVDSNTFAWRTKFNGWDFGVLPIQFAAEITSTQRDFFMLACADWGAAAQVLCVPRTSQNGYLLVAEDDATPADSGCYSNIGQFRRLVVYDLHLSVGCWNQRNVHHELGHAFGFIHEHQRPDRDAYVSVDLSNVAADKQSNFTKLTLLDTLFPYDFLSVMHYTGYAFATDASKPTIIPQPGYASFTSTMGTATLPSSGDHTALAHLYTAPLTPLGSTAPAEAPRTRFDRADFLDAMERLHALYFSRMGLNRSAGLSINNKPDFLGIATWIFDVYLAARSRGFSAEQSFGIVVADVTQSGEWRSKHPTLTPLARPSFTPNISFSRGEFLDALQRLDAFYSAPEGLQRSAGLSISGGPDFLGIATWIFDVYLNERLSGSSSTVAWTRVINAIQNTQEWKSKH